ncbi:adenine-specific DNA-methyltransferase [Brevibacterium sanguinis]|uniref:Adenine-specific DNA-methyltransferase n=2 Tax=Brevibacterium TaxID=1696 RepID=A0A366IJ10_9MICO|nr:MULTISPECIES: site-specific DNA-methyltransferase [Brevibacterium]RBP62227.1 adenine-specific DNA-methyltransferase [Brevibacterium sanguinis]RBP70641.1 adenine-specific DNA-methyltransferase [Brevibacterium celere]
MRTTLDWPGKAAAFALGRESISSSRPSPHLLRRGERAVPEIGGNHLVVGDNLPALTALLCTHRGRVKVVYIDPPYNTGSALAYKDHGHDHASWLSFMTPRLMLARELLRDDGVLFLHLDDGESAWAQLLGHEIFGEENSLGTLIHQRAKGGGNSPSFVRGHDYVHVWGKDAEQVGPFLTEKKAPAKLEVIDGRRMLVETDVLRAGFGRYVRGQERRLMYEDILAVKGAKKLAEVDAKLASGDYILRPWSGGKHAVVRVTPAEKASSKLYSIIKALGGHNDLDRLGLGGVFSYPKPVDLVKTLVASQTFFDPDAIVLDFFAGSGTTAEAVMAANRRDEGRRTFILVQTPEPLRRRVGARVSGGAVAAGVPGGAAGADDSAGAEFTTISELTAERIRRAADILAPGLAFDEFVVGED